MTIGFPPNPTLNQMYSVGGFMWRWDGVRWTKVGNVGYNGSAGFIGSVGFQGSVGIGYQGSSGQTINSFFAVWNGVNGQQLGVIRRYFNFNVNLNKITAWVSATSLSPLTIRLNKNGSQVTTVTIPAGQTFANTTFTSTPLIADTDYLTLDIVSGVGTNIGARIDYLG